MAHLPMAHLPRRPNVQLNAPAPQLRKPVGQVQAAAIAPISRLAPALCLAGVLVQRHEGAEVGAVHICDACKIQSTAIASEPRLSPALCLAGFLVERHEDKAV